MLLAGAAAPPQPVSLSAQQIALYGDRRLLVAEGGVIARVGGERIDATRAVLDLQDDVLTAAGSVRVNQTPAAAGSGYRYDLRAHRGEFVTGATVVQLATNEANVLAQQAEVRGRTIDFTNAQVLTGGVLEPSASYTYVVPAPSSKDFGYSPVPSAALEYPRMLGSGRDAYSFARLRYDRYNGGPGVGLEEHYARTGRGYAVLGETLDVDGARFDLASYQRINATLTQTLTGSALFDAHALRYALAASGPSGYAAFSISQYDATRTDDLYATSASYAVGHLGQLRFQTDLAHDIHPASFLGSQDLRLTPGLHFDLAALHLGPAAFTTSADLGETWYGDGFATTASDLGIWANLPVNRRLLLTGNVAFSHNAPPFAATLRTYSGGMTWHASDAFRFIGSLTYANDAGQTYGYGRPQFSAAIDMLALRRNGTGIDVGAIVPFGTLGNFSRATVLNLRYVKR